jgi:SAM-dependent methyltransferase
MSEYYRPLQEALSQEPQNLRDIVQAMDQGDGKIDSCFLDTLLGIPRFISYYGQEYISNHQYPDRYGLTYRDYIYQGIPYRLAQLILHEVNPTKDDIVYDIGSGYGRFTLYGALTTDATFKGIEFVEHRFEAATGIKEHFEIENATFIHGDAARTKMDDGTIFFMFNPFWPDAQKSQFAVENNLRKIAETKPITVVTCGMKEVSAFPRMWEERFEKVSNPYPDPFNVEIFRST